MTPMMQLMSAMQNQSHATASGPLMSSAPVYDLRTWRDVKRHLAELKANSIFASLPNAPSTSSYSHSQHTTTLRDIVPKLFAIDALTKGSNPHGVLPLLLASRKSPLPHLKPKLHLRDNDKLSPTVNGDTSSSSELSISFFLPGSGRLRSMTQSSAKKSCSLLNLSVNDTAEASKKLLDCRTSPETLVLSSGSARQKKSKGTLVSKLHDLKKMSISLEKSYDVSSQDELDDSFQTRAGFSATSMRISRENISLGSPPINNISPKTKRKKLPKMPCQRFQAAKVNTITVLAPERWEYLYHANIPINLYSCGDSYVHYTELMDTFFEKLAKTNDLYDAYHASHDESSRQSSEVSQ